MSPIGVTELVAPRILLVCHVQRLYQVDLGRWEHTSRDPAIWATGPGLETRVWSAVDLAIPWRSLAIRPDQEDLETQADLGRWEHTTRDPAIWATGLGLETRVWSVADLAIP